MPEFYYWFSSTTAYITLTGLFALWGAKDMMRHEQKVIRYLFLPAAILFLFLGLYESAKQNETISNQERENQELKSAIGRIESEQKKTATSLNGIANDLSKPITPLPLPDVELRLIYPKLPALLIANNSKAIAKDIKWAVVFFNMDAQAQSSILPIPTSLFDWIKPGQYGGPNGLFDMSLTRQLLKTGDHLMGSMAVNCPKCSRGHTYIVYIKFGEGGWISELKNNKTGTPLMPKNLSVLPDYFKELEALAPISSRINIMDN